MVVSCGGDVQLYTIGGCTVNAKGGHNGVVYRGVSTQQWMMVSSQCHTNSIWSRIFRCTRAHTPVYALRGPVGKLVGLHMKRYVCCRENVNMRCDIKTLCRGEGGKVWNRRVDHDNQDNPVPTLGCMTVFDLHRHF